MQIWLQCLLETVLQSGDCKFLYPHNHFQPSHLQNYKQEWIQELGNDQG
jgi:hypothetical protein